MGRARGAHPQIHAGFGKDALIGVHHPALMPVGQNAITDRHPILFGNLLPNGRNVVVLNKDTLALRINERSQSTSRSLLHRNVQHTLQIWCTVAGLHPTKNARLDAPYSTRLERHFWRFCLLRSPCWLP